MEVRSAQSDCAFYNTLEMIAMFLYLADVGLSLAATWESFTDDSDLNLMQINFSSFIVKKKFKSYSLCFKIISSNLCL